ncbi:uncharacterized protein METZ01_LOCUS168024, partial [marine metagenome]
MVDHLFPFFNFLLNRHFKFIRRRRYFLAGVRQVSEIKCENGNSHQRQFDEFFYDGEKDKDCQYHNHRQHDGIGGQLFNQRFQR